MVFKAKTGAKKGRQGQKDIFASVAIIVLPYYFSLPMFEWARRSTTQR